MAFSNPVVGGANGVLIRPHIMSPDYVPGVSGWSINRDGSAEFNNVTIRFELGAGSVVVGPAGSPQVVIRSTGTEGVIEFPTNDPTEIDPAFIKSEIVRSGFPDETLDLLIQSPEVTNANNAYVRLSSGQDALADDQKLEIGLNGVAGFPQEHKVLITATQTDISSPLVVFDNEIYVGTNNTDVNYPSRIVGGKTAVSDTNTTITSGGTPATVAGASSSVRLVNGAAYEVNVTIAVSATTGPSAAGTQRITWTLWRGAVGGIRLGALNRHFKVGAVGSMQEDMHFSFLFNFTGTTGMYTLNLGAQQTNGTDTLQANVNANYFMVVKRIGDPAMIENL